MLTDSGGVQEETTALGVPCITIRESTERPVTVAEGTNIVVGTNPVRIVDAARHVINGGHFIYEKVPSLWDGQAAARVMAKC